MKKPTEYVSIWQHNSCLLWVSIVGKINLKRSGCGGNEHKLCTKRCKWVKLGENAIFPMWKKHQNQLSNNNDAQSITKYGFVIRPNAQIVALRLRGPLNALSSLDAALLGPQQTGCSLYCPALGYSYLPGKISQKSYCVHCRPLRSKPSIRQNLQQKNVRFEFKRFSNFRQIHARLEFMQI